MEKVLLRLAWRNVIRNWRHSLATLMAIAMGFFSISIFDGFIQGIQDRIRDGYISRGMLGQVLVFHQGARENLETDFWAYTMSKREQDFLEDFVKSDPDFRIRVRHLRVSGMISNGRNTAVFIGAGHDIVEGAELRGKRWGWDAVAGKPLFRAPSPAVLLGLGLGSSLDCEASPKEAFFARDGGMIPAERPFHCFRSLVQMSTMTEHGQVNALEAEVAGLMDIGIREANSWWVGMSLVEAQALLDTDRITLYGIQLKEGARSDAFIDRLREASRHARLDLDIVPWEGHPSAQNMKKLAQILFVFRNLFMAVLMIIAVISITNTMMKSVSERIREIGTLRSIGFLSRALTRMFAYEGLFLAGIACIVGGLTALISCWIIARLGFTYRAGVLSTPIPLEVIPVPGRWLVTAFLMGVLASSAAWISARRATRKSAAEALSTAV